MLYQFSAMAHVYMGAEIMVSESPSNSDNIRFSREDVHFMYLVLFLVMRKYVGLISLNKTLTL